MPRGYGQYCPLALAAEVLGERWTLLVLSRVIDGCTTFSAIRRGVPRISPSLLSKRLGELEEAGLITKTDTNEGIRYGLTPASRDLEPVIMQLAVWGQHWARDLTHDDLDPEFLAWSMHTRIDVDAMPDHRIVLEFELRGAREGWNRFWLVVENRTVEMCLKHPGHAVDLTVRAELARFIEAWRGFRNLRREIREGHIDVEGPPKLARELPRWLLLSALAPYERRAAGRERALSRPRKSSRSGARD